MSKEWYYASAGKQQGPVSTEELTTSLGTGGLSPGDLVWTEGMPDWLPAASVPELGAGMPAASIPVGGAPAAVGHSAGVAPLPNLNYYNPTPAGSAAAYAGFWLRFVAYIIDYLLIWVVQFLVTSILQSIVNSPLLPSPRNSWGMVPFQLSGGLTVIILQWLYFALMESSVYRATLGKMAVGIMVTDVNGTTISFGRATGRYFGKLVSGLILYIGFIMIGFTDRKQGLHDMMAHTLVVRKTLPQR